MDAGDSATSSLEVRVLGTFRFWAQGSALPAVLGGSQRLLALLGLSDRALMRASVAGTLWPESTDRVTGDISSGIERTVALAHSDTVMELVDDWLQEILRAASDTVH